jgi:hypothetical protein
MKPVYGILLGVVFVSAAVPLMTGGIMWWAKANSREEPWLLDVHRNSGSRHIITDSNPPVQPAGTVPMTVRITPDAATGKLNLPGYKAVLLVSKKSEKLQKDVVMPVVTDALVLSVEPSGSAPGELLVSFAVPEDQTELLLYAMESGTGLQIKLQGCGGWSAHETDTAVFLAPAKSSEELLAFLSDE